MRNDLTKEVVHYIVERCNDPKKLGATKLNKILWFADSYAYRKTGKPITQSGYQKLQHGPVPKNMLSALRDLAAENKIRIKEVEYFGRMKREFTSIAAANLGALSEEQRNIIDQIADDICNDFTASEISELSHDLAWEAAALGEEIPMSAVLVNEVVPVSEEDKKWAEKIVSAHAKAKAA